MIKVYVSNCNANKAVKSEREDIIKRLTSRGFNFKCSTPILSGYICETNDNYPIPEELFEIKVFTEFSCDSVRLLLKSFVGFASQIIIGGEYLSSWLKKIDVIDFLADTGLSK